MSVSLVLSLHISELTFRSVGQFRPKRQGRRREGDGTVAMLVQYKLPVLVLTGVGRPWYNAVNSGTDAALSLNRHGVGAGCT